MVSMCMLKVGISGMAISETWVTAINEQFKKFLKKVWVKLLLLLENALKLNLRPSNWNFELSPRAHTHSDLIINKHTEQVKKITYGFFLSWSALNCIQCSYKEKMTMVEVTAENVLNWRTWSASQKQQTPSKMFHALIPKKENKKQKGRKSIIDIT